MLFHRRRRTIPRVVPYRSHPRLKWTVAGYYVNRKRVRKFFETKQEAQTFVDQVQIITENLGVQATQIDHRFHAMAIECHHLLSPYGKTIADATEFYRQHLDNVQRSCRVNELASSFIEAKEADGNGQRYLKTLHSRLGRFQKTFGQQVIATISPHQCNQWLRNLPCGPETRNSYRRVLNTFFADATDQGYCAENPIKKTAVAKETDKPVGVLTPQQTRALLDNASHELIPFIAIGAFAGLRVAEIGRLDWKEIHLDRNFIEVTAAKSKTAKRRLVTILPILREWLIPHKKTHGPIEPRSREEQIKQAREKAGIVSWPKNALRHSYASYHLAKYQNAAHLALELGHATTDMLFKHYREVVTPEAAEQYWQIVPATQNQVPIGPFQSTHIAVSQP